MTALSQKTPERTDKAPASFGRVLLLMLYYILVLLGAIVMHATGSFDTPAFVYQGF